MTKKIPVKPDVILKIEGEEQIYTTVGYISRPAKLTIQKELQFGKTQVLYSRRFEREGWSTPFYYATYYPITIERYDDLWGIAYELKGISGYSGDVSIRINIVPNKDRSIHTLTLFQEGRELASFNANLSSVKKIYGLVKNMMEIK